MATLHGSWVIQPERSFFFLWVAAWQAEPPDSPDSDTALPRHPFNGDRLQLTRCLPTLGLKLDLEPVPWDEVTLTLPSQKTKKTLVPLLAGQDGSDLKANQRAWQPWRVQGLALTAIATLELLQQIPLGEYPLIGPDLRFFTHLYRWSLDLLVRQKFLPTVGVTPEGHQGQWLPLLESVQDQTRLAQFSQQMPAVCLSYGLREGETLGQHQPPSQARYALILHFLQQILQAQIVQSAVNLPLTKETVLQQWLKSLVDSQAFVPLSAYSLQKLTAALDNWQIPVKAAIAHPDNPTLYQSQFRLALVLVPPDHATENWQLNYGLQALGNPDWFLPASVLWQHNENTGQWQGYEITNPQEILLTGLGLAARLYAPIAASLEQTQPQKCELDTIQVFEFIKATAWQLQDQGLGVILPPSLREGATEKRLGLKLLGQVTAKPGERLTLKSLLDYQLQLTIGEQVISAQDFQALLEQRSPLVQIQGQWITLQPNDVKAAQAILNQTQEPLNFSVEDALRLVTGDNQMIAKLPVVSFEATGILKELINNLTNNQAIQSIDNPPGFQGSLRPYQAKGVGWLAFLEKWGLGACLADDMGLGKTPQLLAFLLHLKAEKMLVKPVLIVCPTSVLTNWFHEVQKFAPSLSCYLHHGDRRSKGEEFQRTIAQKNLVLTSYSLLDRDSQLLKNQNWQGIVLDEAQNIKNAQTKQAQVVRQLPANFRIALTGTPVENRLAELWSLLDFLNPGFLGTPSFFQRRFANPIEKFGDRQSLEILRSLVRPFILRRLKTDASIIQDLPEKQEMTVFCSLSLEQADLYQQLVDKSLQEIDDSSGIQRKGLILSLLVKLKQICNHPAQFLKETHIPNAQASGKLLRLEEMLEEVIIEGDRALIFTQFAEWGKLLQGYLQKQFKQDVLFLYGATSRTARQAMVDRFQNDPDGPALFILSLKAGGTGLNLTRANHVFHCDRWWNPAVENQATDRAFRIGQTRNVQVHKFVCTGTLEEKIHDLIESKKQLAEQTVDAGENWLTELDTDQLRNLILLDRQAIIEDS